MIISRRINVKCSKCGKELKGNAIFCGYCGNNCRREGDLNDDSVNHMENCRNDEDGSVTELEERTDHVSHITELVSSQPPIENEMVTEKDVVHQKENPKVKKKGGKIKPILFIIFLIMLFSIGWYSGYYVAENGLEGIPFGDKIQPLFSAEVSSSMLEYNSDTIKQDSPDNSSKEEITDEDTKSKTSANDKSKD